MEYFSMQNYGYMIKYATYYN